MVGIIGLGKYKLVDGLNSIGDRLLGVVLIGLECKVEGIGLFGGVEVRLRCEISDRSKDMSEDMLGDDCSDDERIEFQKGSWVTGIELTSSSETE